MEKPKRKHKPKRDSEKIACFQVASVLLGLMCLVGTLAYTVLSAQPFADVSLNQLYLGDEARSRVESTLVFFIPLEASNIQYYEMQLPMIDWGRYLRFEISADSDLSWATEHTCFDELISNAQLQYMPSIEQIDGWEPHAATNYVSAFCGNNPYYQIMIDTSDDITWIVYLTAYME